MASLKLAVLVFCVASVAAVPAQNEARGNSIQTENDLLDSIYHDCLRKDSYSCLKVKLFNFVDKMLGHKDSITIADGVQLVKTSDEKDGAPRSIGADDSLESMLWNRVSGFLETHEIKINLKGSEIVNTVANTARSFSDVVDSLSEEENSVETDEARGKKKKAAKILGPLLAAAALKAAVLGKLALAGIALIAGKALIIGKIALVLSAIIGLKKLLGGQGKHVTYEVVSHPQHSTSHVTSHETVYGGATGGGYGGSSDSGYSSSGHGGGWGRSFEGQQLAYRGYKQANQQ
ncbi:keratin, type II cytoskeletal 1 [Harmonia axyridis]|uniref:keratin, type II cytoskeletal 1 n=1 Tax=Harmonia axyridis TaxID=115357 RepID=UPI001E278808|nr:keratin, type II cytoskeletal 1 [Harmonia axyridis]